MKETPRERAERAARRMDYLQLIQALRNAKTRSDDRGKMLACVYRAELEGRAGA